MEHICVYSQRSSRSNPELLVGEDALPFANQSGMFVADGLGGSAGIRVDKIPEELFDPQVMADKICNILPNMPGFTDQYDRVEAFHAYLKEHFASLCNKTMHDIYQDTEKNVGNLKKSGYIGSHVLGAVMCYLLNCIDVDHDVSLKENAERLRDTLPEFFMKLIAQLKIRYRETNMTRMEPYASTLSAVLYQENESDVDAVFLNCGDSRSYILDMDGLRQAADDQGRNGGMTSLVSYKQLMETGSIQISLEEKKFQKPCIIMSVSDGVYGIFVGPNGFTSSPLFMEGMLLGQLANADSYEALRTGLKSLFDRVGHADDSNSAAIAFFGFENYEAVREFSRKRNEKMYADYSLGEMPKDIMTVDYAAKFRQMSSTFAEGNKDLLQQAYEDPFIQDYSKTHYQDECFNGKFISECVRLERELNDKDDQLDENEKQLERLVRENFTDCISQEKPEPVKGFWLPKPKAVDRYKRVSDYTEQYLASKNSFQQEINHLGRLYNDYSDYLQSIRQSKWEDPFLDLRMSTNDDIQSRICKTLNLMDTNFHRGKELEKAVLAENLAASEECEAKNPHSVKDFVSKLIDRDDIGLVRENTIFPTGRQAIKAVLEERKLIREQRNQVVQELALAREQSQRSYWLAEGGVLIPDLLNIELCLASNPELKAEFLKRIQENEELNQCGKVKEQQEKLFADYMTVHLREISPESTKHEDVRKNSWH